ncbi:MAG: hypothetical protein R3F30_00845 [Planctomycetota bacterium]
MEAPRDRQLLLLLVLVFACGFLGGSLSRRLRDAIVGGPETEVKGPNRIFVEEFARRYGLDRTQRRELRLVLEDRDRRRLEILEDLRRTSDPTERERLLDLALEVNRRADLRIPEILRADQREGYLTDLGPDHRLTNQ